MNTKNALRLVVTLFAVGLAACATQKSVDEKIAAAQAQNSQKIESVTSQVEDLQTKQKATDTHLQQSDQQIAQLSTTAQDALKSATDAGVLAKGKVVFEQTFSEMWRYFTAPFPVGENPIRYCARRFFSISAMASDN